MKRPALETVFFDWDHTLAYTKTPQNTPSERMAHMFRSAGLPYTEAEIAAGLERYAADAAAGKIEAKENPQTRRDIVGIYRYLLKHLGHKQQSWELYRRLYGTYADLPTFFYPGSRPTLRAVHEMGFKIGIISNHSHSARPVIESMVADLVPPELIIISEEVGVHKPAKTIFRQAAMRARTKPGACLLVGDNLHVDAKGAVCQGGFRCGVWLDRANGQAGITLPRQVVRITGLRQLLPLLDGDCS